MSNKNSLWAVKKGNQTHYMLGSAHFLKQENYPLNTALEDAFNHAEVVVVETDLSSMDPEAIGKLFYDKGIYSDGETLQSNVTAETFNIVQGGASDFGFDMNELNQFKPWYLWILFTLYIGQRLGLDDKHGIDKYFLAKAKTTRKKIVGLETVEEQVEFFNSLPPKIQELKLVNTLSSIDDVKSGLEKINQAWLTGDVEALEALTLEYSQKYPEANKAIITERNRNWLPHIESYLHSLQCHIVIVGVSHFVGEQGILRALQIRGYIVDQL
jgi:uncharacterized protein